MQPAPLPKVKKDCVRWWIARLELYRSLVVFIWNALSFYESNVLPGVTVWLGMSVTVMVLLRMSDSIIQTAGQTLVIVALLYLLLHLAPKVSETELFPQWTPEFENRFRHVCTHVAHAEEQVQKGLRAAMEVRIEKPWKFYCILLVLSLILMELGRWISATIFLLLLVWCVLSLPFVLEYGLLSKQNQKQFKLMLTEIYIKIRSKLEETAAARRQR